MLRLHCTALPDSPGRGPGLEMLLPANPHPKVLPSANRGLLLTTIRALAFFAVSDRLVGIAECLRSEIEPTDRRKWIQPLLTDSS